MDQDAVDQRTAVMVWDILSAIVLIASFFFIFRKDRDAIQDED